MYFNLVITPNPGSRNRPFLREDKEKTLSSGSVFNGYLFGLLPSAAATKSPSL